jgi:quinol monooxygenase YgiN
MVSSAGQKEGVNSAPPTISFGNMLGGWLTRPGESKRTSDQIILYAKYTIQSGKRDEFSKVLVDGMSTIKTAEPGTLSILLIEDVSDPDVVYVMERFENQAAMDAHMNGDAGKAVGPTIKALMKNREGGVFKEVAGFLSKDE